jgi:hypothetical protein
MNKSNKEISIKELDNLEQLYSLYSEIMKEIKEDEKVINKEKNMDNIANMEFSTLIKLIKESISYLLNKKIENALNNYKNNTSKKIIKDNERILYESQLKNLESQIRFYIKKQIQYKIQRETLENKIKSFEEMEMEFEEMKEKLKYENGEFLNNDRKESEIEILKRENSNLKKAIEKIEKEKIIIEGKLKEKIIDIDDLKNQIENYKKIVLKIEQSQKDISTNSSININHQNSNIIIKQNIETTNSNYSNSKKTKNKIINNSQINQQQKTFYNTKKNSFIHIENHINYSSTINNIVSNISNKTPKKITKGHHKTNSVNMKMDENKKNIFMSKYFSNQKIINSFQKSKKKNTKIFGDNKPISYRQKNNYQLSSASKVSTINVKSNKKINKSTLNFKSSSKENN